MSNNALKSLTIANLRGTTSPLELTFDKGKKLTIIYGENGTGKSTICDALEFFGGGKVGSLDKRGLGKPEKYWPSVGKVLSEITVTLGTYFGDCKAVYVGSEVKADPPSLRGRVEVLRKNRISELTESTASNRYKAIAKFIDVTGVEESEKGLSQALKDARQQSVIAATRVNESRSTIENFWTQAGNPGYDSINWAREESTREFEVLESRSRALMALTQSFEKLRDLAQQRMALRKAGALAETCYIQAMEKSASLRGQVRVEFSGALELLQAALEFFELDGNTDVCPLCDSRENAKGLRDRIVAKLSAKNSAVELKMCEDRLVQAERSLELCKSRLEEFAIQASQNLQNYETARSHPDLPPHTVTPTLILPAESADWSSWLTPHLTSAENWDRDAQNHRELRRVRQMLSSSLKSLDENAAIAEETQRLVPVLEQALKVVGDERKAYTDGVLSGISEEVGRLYELVHPGEGLQRIRLELNPNQRASLDISTNFLGAVAPPQAYLSDSHLDTLGLCIFLALSAKDGSQETILVLDDVLGSVDEPHVDRLVEMLYGEASRFKHCLITTHYRPWKHKLRWGWLAAGACQFVELGKWSHSKGVCFVRTLPETSRLRALLEEEDPDLQAICSKAGVLLEAALDFLTLLYECAVPRKPEGRYTLNDLLPNIDKKLRAALKVEILCPESKGNRVYLTRELGPCLTKIQSMFQIRNIIGCHFNEISYELLDSDAVVFGKCVLDLMSWITCEENGWPRQSKSGSYWTTSGETRRLHPLKKPG